MKFHINFRDPSPSHCKVAVFVNGALAGELTLRQEELYSFQQIILEGCAATGHAARSDGDPGENTQPRPVAEFGD